MRKFLILTIVAAFGLLLVGCKDSEAPSGATSMESQLKEGAQYEPPTGGRRGDRNPDAK